MYTDLAVAMLRLIALGVAGLVFAAVGLYLFVCVSGNQPKGDHR